MLAVMLLFCYKKLPDASRSLGRSLRIFTSEVEEARTPADVVEQPIGRWREPAQDAGRRVRPGKAYAGGVRADIVTA